MKKIYILLVTILVILIGVFYIKGNNNLEYENIYIEETGQSRVCLFLFFVQKSKSQWKICVKTKQNDVEFRK